MQAAHAAREDYTPPYEPRQGLLPSLFPADYQQETPAAPAPAADPVKPLDKKTATTKPAKAKLPGKPGRPAAA
jgi:hypothetical protein